MPGAGDQPQHFDCRAREDSEAPAVRFAVAWQQEIRAVTDTLDAALAFAADRFDAGLLPSGAQIVITELAAPAAGLPSILSDGSAWARGGSSRRPAND